MYSINFVITKNAINVCKEQKEHAFEIRLRSRRMRDQEPRCEDAGEVLQDDGDGEVGLRELHVWWWR